MRSMEHCWFLVHGRYCIFCCMLRLKKPCNKSKWLRSSVGSSQVQRFFSSSSSTTSLTAPPSTAPAPAFSSSSEVGDDIFSRSPSCGDVSPLAQLPPPNSALIHPISRVNFATWLGYTCHTLKDGKGAHNAIITELRTHQTELRNLAIESHDSQ